MKTKPIKQTALFVIATGLAAWPLPAQETNPPPPHHAPPPILVALDANKNRVIDADEITNAGEALKPLDSSGDGKLSFYELLLSPLGDAGSNDPAPPENGSPAPEASASPSPAHSAWDHGIPTAPRKSSNQSQTGQRPPPPLMPAAMRIIAALDTNQDYYIDADEMKNASEALKKLDTNADGKITIDELVPPPPQNEPQSGSSPSSSGGQSQTNSPGNGLRPPTGPSGPPPQRRR